MAKLKQQILRDESESESLIVQYLVYQRNLKRRSELTIQSYESKLFAFQEYFLNRDDTMTWESVSTNIITDYIMDLMTVLSSASVRLHLSALKSFFRFLKTSGKILNNPASCISPPKVSKRLPKFIREDDMNKLLDTGEFWEDTYDDILAKTVILIFYHTGIRLAELVSMDECNVDLYSRTIKVTGKGNKQRIIPFGDELYNAFIKYNGVRKQIKRTGLNNDIKAYLISKNGERITQSKVSHIVKEKLSLVTTQQNISPHILRHTFATAMLNNGASLESIRLLLGHASIKVTQIYTHVAFNKLTETYNKAFKR